MSTEAYELLALGMRYWFALLGVVIVLRSFSWLRREQRARRRALHQLPDAGMVGEIVWLEKNKSFPLPREGVIGASRACDIRIPARGVGARHAALHFAEGEGVRVTPLGRARVYQGGEPLPAGVALTHGERLEIGGETLRIRLFAGLNVPRAMAFQPDEAEHGGEAAAPPEEGEEVCGEPWDETMWSDEALPEPAAQAEPVSPAAPGAQTWVAPDGTVWAPVRPSGEQPPPPMDETWPYLYAPEEVRGAQEAPGGWDEPWYAPGEEPEAPPREPRRRSGRRGRA